MGGELPSLGGANIGTLGKKDSMFPIGDLEGGGKSTPTMVPSGLIGFPGGKERKGKSPGVPIGRATEGALLGIGVPGTRILLPRVIGIPGKEGRKESKKRNHHHLYYHQTASRDHRE
jgi:hypothetical protein